MTANNIKLKHSKIVLVQHRSGGGGLLISIVVGKATKSNEQWGVIKGGVAINGRVKMRTYHILSTMECTFATYYFFPS